MVERDTRAGKAGRARAVPTPYLEVHPRDRLERADVGHVARCEPVRGRQRLALLDRNELLPVLETELERVCLEQLAAPRKEMHLEWARDGALAVLVVADRGVHGLRGLYDSRNRASMLGIGRATTELSLSLTALSPATVRSRMQGVYFVFLGPLSRHAAIYARISEDRDGTLGQASRRATGPPSGCHPEPPP